eukprot:m.141175 g.141175  ORF g.141175 m.141175 type:complete len:122 (-) comp14841_c1_seq4:1171-1536(-)
MATVDELKHLLKDTLHKRGVLDRVRAQIRAEIYSALDDAGHQEPPEPSVENALINELIREYLAFNHYNYTLSTFMSEAGHTKPPLERSFLKEELNVTETPGTATPLLYGLVASYTTRDGKA